jgi:hypothetical protein
LSKGQSKAEKDFKIVSVHSVLSVVKILYLTERNRTGTFEDQLIMIDREFPALKQQFLVNSLAILRQLLSTGKVVVIMVIPDLVPERSLH